MANQQYTISNTDVGTSAFTVPGDQDGGAGDDSFTVEPDNLDVGRQWYVHVDNGFNENVDVTVQGSHFLDESMDSAVDDGATETVNSSSSGAFDGTTGHTYLQINVTPAADPTSGDLVVTFQSREE